MAESGGETVLDRDLHAFGNRSGPRAPRSGADVNVDPAGMVGPETGTFPAGASTFADVNRAPLGGHFHRLPAGTRLPKGLAVMADGADVDPMSSHSPTHHTIFPSVRMKYDEFVAAYLSLPWVYVGRK